MHRYLSMNAAAAVMGRTRQSLRIAVLEGRIEPAIRYDMGKRRTGYLFDRAAAEAIGAERRKRGVFGVKYGPRKRG